MNAVIIIPARWESSRFPGKPLADILGKSLIERVYQQCVKTNFITIVATDDERIVDHCDDKGMKCMMTSKDCVTGTDRVAEAYSRIYPKTGDCYETIINVQGDEPLVKPEDIIKVAKAHSMETYNVFCGMCEATEEEFNNPNIVKVVAKFNDILYYASRAGIPTTKKLEFKRAHRQVCIYAFSPQSLSDFGHSPQSAHEQIEDIEILRFINSVQSVYVKMVEVSDASVAVNVPEDVDKVIEVLTYKDRVKEEINSTIAIDFDGVIHKNSKGFHDGTIYDDPVEGTKKALSMLARKHRLIIYTCKSKPDRPLTNRKSGKELIHQWLCKHNLNQYISDVTHEKPRAKYYIDDNAIRFKNWKQAFNEIDSVWE